LRPLTPTKKLSAEDIEQIKVRSVQRRLSDDLAGM
jgi:hypothetical protein